MSYYSINKIKNVECNFEWSSKEFWKSDVKSSVQKTIRCKKMLDF